MTVNVAGEHARTHAAYLMPEIPLQIASDARRRSDWCDFAIIVHTARAGQMGRDGREQLSNGVMRFRNKQQNHTKHMYYVVKAIGELIVVGHRMTPSDSRMRVRSGVIRCEGSESKRC